jgi:hypothetical protein
MEVSCLVGKTLVSVDIDVDRKGEDVICFKTTDGEIYELGHRQDCCESVSIESIVGELSDLVGAPILLAEEVTSHENPPDPKVSIEYQDSFTWTFYKFATVKGYVDIRWYGESNGYYSESVDFYKV